MNIQLQKVAEMIKKTFHTKQQEDCFNGCTLYIEEHCATIRSVCMKGMERRFKEVCDKLDVINSNIKDIKKEIGLNGTSEG